MNQSSNHFNLYFMFCIELINDGVLITGKISKSFKNGWLGKTLEKKAVFSYSKWTRETPNQSVKSVSSQQQRHQNDFTDVVLTFSC